MNDRTDSETKVEPDADRLWLQGHGAEIKVTRTDDPRALAIVTAVRDRYVKKTHFKNGATPRPH